jgi:hypothetical protein
MEPIDFAVLEACHEVAARQHEMLPQLAAAINVPEYEVFYEWALRRCKQSGKLENSDWTYFFHGLECDLRNHSDGRILRIDFGPQGRVGILDRWGVLRFIMTSVAPWKAFPQLRTLLADSEPPFSEHSGSAEKMGKVWDRLEHAGAFAQADPTLVALRAQHTARGPDGLNYLRFPPEITDCTRADCSVAHRQQLSLRGFAILDALKQSQGIGLDPSQNPLIIDAVVRTPEPL